MSEKPLGLSFLGLHHATAIAGTPRQVMESYGQIPGLKLVKKTVNYDDPGAYHLYFGAGTGTPGTLLTFFPWATAAHPEGRPGTQGSGQISKVTLTDSPRLECVTLCEADAGPTVAFLRDTLGLRQVEPNRLELADGAFFEVLHAPKTPRGKMGAGIFHHVALRVADEEAQMGWREKLLRAGVRVSAVRDHFYFHSIYFREPGGVLLEIATDGPGFLIDERAERLGERLCLPPWLEPSRESIERRLREPST